MTKRNRSGERTWTEKLPMTLLPNHLRTGWRVGPWEVASTGSSACRLLGPSYLLKLLVLYNIIGTSVSGRVCLGWPGPEWIRSGCPGEDIWQQHSAPHEWHHDRYMKATELSLSSAKQCCPVTSVEPAQPSSKTSPKMALVKTAITTNSDNPWASWKWELALTD